MPLVLSLGSSLSSAEYTQHLILPVVRAFASPDRLMRMALLENLPTYVERLDQKTVVDKIWPNLVRRHRLSGADCTADGLLGRRAGHSRGDGQVDTAHCAQGALGIAAPI